MKKQYNVIFLYVFCAVSAAFLSSCEDEILMQPTETGEKWVEVSLTIGLDQPEDGYTPLPHTRNKEKETGLTIEPVPSATTRAMQLIPDKLYNLEIGQYDANGNRITNVALGTQEIGQPLTLGLQERTGCQLLVIVRGASGFLGSIGTNSLAGIRSGISTLWSNITNLPAENPSQVDINKMPYVLLLKDVNVTAEGKIINPEGKDVRLLLKRLAARVTVTWDFKISGYELNEVSLQQVPKLYRVLPTPYDNIGGVETYPSLLDEYVNAYRLISGATENPLTEQQKTQGSRTVWVPANVRGVVPDVVNQTYRSKDNAPIGAMYAEFRVEKTKELKRLFCRAYIGANSTSDFNVYENTDYSWNVTLSKGNLIDPRVTGQSLDVVRSENLVNTANCFMMEPGSDICFNPYKHVSGTNGWNDKLVDLSSGSPMIITPIHSMKVVWQMKDAGMTGDLVMGYAKDAIQQQNLVDVTNADDPEKALVHVITPVTKGGNAIIGAYDIDGNILWSWHLWITSYVPQRVDASIPYTTAQQLSKDGTVHRYNNAIFNTGVYQNRVIMDRNLGATAGNFPGKNATSSEFAKRYGVSYEYGRKDPFFSSVDGTKVNKNVIYDGFGNSMEVKTISAGAGGVQKDGTTLEYTIRNPYTYIHSGYNRSWYSTTQSRLQEVASFWQKDDVTKALYNPCPDGWMVPRSDFWAGINVDNAQWFHTNLTFVASTQAAHEAKGGRLYRLSGANGAPEDSPDINAYSWFPVTGYRDVNGIQLVNKGFVWGWNTHSGYKYNGYYARYAQNEFYTGIYGGYHNETCMIRCVQQ